METDTHRTDRLSKRIAHFRKAFAKGLGHKASTLEAAAIDRAARLTALAELAAENPDTPYTDIVRLDHSAARARADMAKVLQAAKPAAPGPDALRAYLASKQAASA